MYKTRSLLISLLFVFFLCPGSLFGQYFNTGQDPAKIKWLQVRTGKFTVVYPESYGEQGIEFAKSLERADSDLAPFFPAMKIRLPVVIHNYTVESNGFVAWAPERMEIFPTPEQNSIPLDPERQLALHELTHVMQMESLDNSTTKVLSYLFGQQIIGAEAIYLPTWFLEGDAVFSETVLSGSGRGRSPDFLKELKAISIEKDGVYNYDKMLNGSFRDYTPDHYQFGYQMVTWSFAKNGTGLWNKVLKLTAVDPVSLNPVNQSLRRSAGLTKKRLYYQTFDSLNVLWRKDIESSKAVQYKPVNPLKNGNYISYYSPVPAGSDSLIAIKTSLTDLPSFVLIRQAGKSEKRLLTPGYMYPYYLSYAMGKLVWVELISDPRWANREYSVIKIKDIRTGPAIQLTHRSRYMAASISPDGKTIAASENTIDNKNSLVLLSSASGLAEQRIPVPGNASIQRPQWSDDGKKITVIYLTKDGEGIMSYFRSVNSWKVLVEAGRNDLQSSFLRNDSLFFTSSSSGVENGYLLTPENKLFLITSSRFGANDLTVKGSEIIFCDYTSSGNDICRISLNNAQQEEGQSPKPVSILADRFNYKTDSEADQGKEYNPMPYRKWQHLFSFHSWMPFYTDVNSISSDPSTVRPGVEFLSQNLLSTLTATIGYEYSSDKRNLIHTYLTWNGWYPVIESQLDYGNYPGIYKKSGDPLPASVMSGYQFTNTISLPLTFNSGKFSQFVYFGINSLYQNNYIFINSSSGYDQGQEQLSGRIYLYNYSYNTSYRDIYPKWSQEIDLYYSVWPWDKMFFGPEAYLKTDFYFPGIFRNNSIRLRYEMEEQQFSEYLTGNRIDFPRGYNDIISGKLDFLSVEYAAPLLYPDIHLASLLYLKRIRATLFYDWASGKNNYYLEEENGTLVSNSHTGGPDIFKSFGTELLADFFLFRIPYQMSGGVQAAWKNPGQQPELEVIFNISINGMSVWRKPRP